VILSFQPSPENQKIRKRFALTGGIDPSHNAPMSNVVSIHPYFKTHEGKLDAFLELIPRFVERTLSEEACHWYDFSICGDTVHCREAYDGADGLLTHLGNVDALVAEALTISDLVRVEVHGPAEELEKLKEPLAALNADFYVFQAGIGKP
jgi:quinol monooxygenase YgiN